MIVHTNNNAVLLKAISQMNRYNRKDVNKDEFKRFFVVIMYISINPKPSIEHYSKLDILYYSPLMHQIYMSYDTIYFDYKMLALF